MQEILAESSERNNTSTRLAKTILGTGCAVPPQSASQSRTASFANGLHTENRAPRALQTLYERSGVTNRHAVVLDDHGEPWFFRAGQPVPSTAMRMQVYEECAAPLAIQAACIALKDSGVAAADITHIIVVSCTGMSSPGVEHALIMSLGLSANVTRLHIGFMGCHAAINALNAACAFSAFPGARVLVVCVELCSLHFQHNINKEGQAVANALFADGAAAVVVGTLDMQSQKTITLLPEIAGFTSVMLPDTRDAMSWRINDTGFEMSLSATVPTIVQSAIAPWLRPWLGAHGLRLPDIRGWVIHPGGPRIVDAVVAGLGLPDSVSSASRETLSRYGNMSSPTVLFVLQSLLDTYNRDNRSQVQEKFGPIVMLAFGPGLVGEACLLV